VALHLRVTPVASRYAPAAKELQHLRNHRLALHHGLDMSVTVVLQRLALVAGHLQKGPVHLSSGNLK
jgi:hypothetical protein